MEPTLTVLLYSSLAAAASGFGVLPLISRRQPPDQWLGWANALAAGLMLGLAYLLLVAGLRYGAGRVAVGALLGILVVSGTHAWSGTGDLDLNQRDAPSPVYPYQVLLLSVLHSAAEGVAIGTAMALSLPFGIFMALAIAAHNVPESTLLCTVLTSRGTRTTSAAGLAVATDLSQVLLAVAAFAVVSAAPTLLPWVAGFAVGALIHLVMLELLPDSYRRAGPTTIALVTIVAMGVVVLLRTAALR